MIDSEYKKNATSDGWREFDLLQYISNQNHRYSRFRIGNFQTLSKNDNKSMIEALNTFRNNH